MVRIHSLFIAGASALVLAGCAINQNVRPVAVTGITQVCIKANPQVMMDDFVKELRSQIEARGVRTSVYDGERPTSCRHHVEYTANWRWDLAMYLAFAKLDVYEDNLLVGQATYDALGGGFRLDKFGPTAEKLRVLVDQLFPKK
jgi:hypothetical protein